MKKIDSKNLRKHYFILFEVGLICSLLFLIAATNIELKSDPPKKDLLPKKQTPIVIDEIPITKDKPKAAPLKPMIFTPEPDNEVITDEIPEFPEFGDYSPISLPPRNDNTEEEVIVDFLAEMPKIIGGQQALYSKIKYPKKAQDFGIEGTVIVQFIIDEKGNVTNPKILRGLGALLDDEVLRVIKLVKFSPGVQNGRLVKVRMAQAIHFKLKN